MEKIKIATGHSRTSKIWKVAELTWSELIERLRNTQRTAETFGEYKNMSKGQQGAVKDVGGFVGGVLAGGRRNNHSVMERHILTLDADSAKQDFIELVAKSMDCDYIIYSTHSHTTEYPRYRLIIRISRPVSPDEYQAVSRRVAKTIGIDYFDDSTYEPSRLMYWPSTSQDGEYIFEEVSFMGGLDVNKTLATYCDWKDMTQWPVSSRVDTVRARHMQQQDPLSKGGIIGAFCKTYSISQAIDKYLSDIYVACDIPGRYTYTKGSTVAGLVVYDDLFAYSNHGTDIASGKLCNAFDLVRLHKYGYLDTDSKDDTPVNKLPSYVKFTGDIINIDEVKGVLIKEKPSIKEAFAGIEEEQDTWEHVLELDKKGNIRQTADNVRLILANDSNLKGICYLDEFAERIRMSKHTPWREISKGDLWCDTDDSGLRIYLEKLYNMTHLKKIEDGFTVWVEEHKMHPVKAYLDSLAWDGQKRLDTLLIDYLGAQDNAYTRAVTRKSLVAGVARIYKPGCKFDNMLVLVGEQGVGKSTIIQKLGMEWHTDSLTNVSGKEGSEQIQGFWLIEMGELTAMKKSEENAVKQFLSKKEDSYRPAYARHTRSFKRRCIFLGTTNVEQFLKDTTGNRRFWAVRTNIAKPDKSVFKDLSQGIIDQIWAEAKSYYIGKEPLYLSPEIERLAEEIQKEYLEESPLAGAVRKYLSMKVPIDFESWDTIDRIVYYREYGKNSEGGQPMRRVCSMMLWVEALGGEPKAFDKMRSKEINDIVRNTEGWKACSVIRFKGDYGTQRGYIKVN